MQLGHFCNAEVALRDRRLCISSIVLALLSHSNLCHGLQWTATIHEVEAGAHQKYVHSPGPGPITIAMWKLLTKLCLKRGNLWFSTPI
eukprot:2457276-Amphidinium_carterae.2